MSLKFRNLPFFTASPSTSFRLGIRWGTMPSRLSNEWFSMIRTTTWSICGIVGVPGGR
jgi:hypothetical protein